MNRFLPDPLIPALLATLAFATLFPAPDEVAEYVGLAANAAIMLLFFLNGVKLPRENLVAAALHWRLHALILGTTFMLLPLLGLGLSVLWPSLLPDNLWAGVLFLCALPSTVQMSVSFTSMARGNVAASVTSAAASNLLGIVLTPLIIGLLLHMQGDEAVSMKGFWKVVQQILLPFVAGHLLRPWLADWAARRKQLISLSDRLIILLAVYRAFSMAVKDGIWSQFPAIMFLVLALICAGLLSAAMLVAYRGARLAGFSEADARSALYCGSFKSIVTGVPMAQALFAGSALGGAIILPVMIYHQLQAMFSATISRRQAKSEP